MVVARIQLLGQLRVTLDGAGCTLPTSRKSRALLTYLALQRDVELARTRLAGLLWGDAEERRARQSLRQALSEVRRTLDGLRGYAWLDATETTVALRGACAIDVEEFLRDTSVVAAGPPAGPPDAASLAALERAAAPGGELLPECYDDWCVEVRQSLATRRQRALRALLDARRGDPAQLQAIGEQLLTLDPLQEDVYRALMAAAARAGDRAAALRRYAECVAALERELGAGPSPETILLYERIRDGLVGPALPDSGAAGFIARERELAALQARLAEAAGGRGGAVVLCGSAGIGKSRLLAEAVSAARLQGWRVVEVGAEGDGRLGPYALWAATVRTLLLTSPGLLVALPPSALPALARLLPETQHLVGAPGGAEPGRADLFAAVLCAVRAATEQPLLLALDDLQWTDEDAAQLFGQVCRAARELPLLLLGTMRDDEAALASPFGRTATALQQAGLVQTLTVPPLDRDAVRALLRQLSGSDAVAHSLSAVTQVETEGNPLHIGELWRAMQEQGRLERDLAGRWRWRGGPEGGRERLPLPLRVRTTVAGRLAARSGRVREALALGAVLGRAWSAALLAAVTERPVEEWRAALREATEHRLVRETAQGCVFAHDVIRETAERELDAMTAQALHLRVAEALEAQGEAADDEAAERTEALARHFTLAGPRGVGRAFQYTCAAATNSRRHLAFARAARQLRVAIDYAEGGWSLHKMRWRRCTSSSPRRWRTAGA